MMGASAAWPPRHADRTRAVDDALLAQCVAAMPLFEQGLPSVDARGWCKDMSDQFKRSHTGVGSDEEGAEVLLRICNENAVLAS